MAMSKKQACASSAEWTDRAVSILLKTYAQKFCADRGYLRTQDWQEVALAVNSVSNHIKSLKQCRDKVDSLKRRYKMEKRKAVTGSEVSWPFFHRLDDIMNSVLKQAKGHHPKHPSTSSAHGSADAEDEGEYDNADDVEEFHEEVEEEAKEEDAEAEEEEGEEEEDGVGGGKEDGDEELEASVSLSACSDSPPYVENGKALGQTQDVCDMSADEDEGLHHRGFYQQSQLPYKQHRQALPSLHLCHYPTEHAYHEHPFLQQHAPSRLYSFSGGTHESTQNSSQVAKADRCRTRSRVAHKRKFECRNGIDALANAVTGLSKPGASSASSFSDILARIELAKADILKKVKLEIARFDQKRGGACTSTKPRLSVSTSS